jgi:DNA-binding transcriptional MerR regulator
MAEKYLRTSDIAKDVGCHPNTVRMYEEWGYIPEAPRSQSNYRLFNRVHLEHMRLAWTAFSGPYPGRTIKRSAYKLVLTAAYGDLGGSLEMAYAHVALVQSEHAQAEAAAVLLERWSDGATTDATIGPLLIGETAKLLHVTTDMLRNWENNGLIQVPRAKNGYRQYGSDEIGRLRVIRMLVRAGYSMMAVLRMMLALDQGKVGAVELRRILDTPRDDEDVFTAADQWLSTLRIQEQKAVQVIEILERMISFQVER